MNKNKIIGDFGEELACQYLRKNGYKIIERNLFIGHKEIDIIAEIGEILVFIEVKTRTFALYGPADEAIYPQKTDILKSAINCYLGGKNIRHDNFRLDYIAIDIQKSKKIAKIKHFKDIF